MNPKQIREEVMSPEEAFVVSFALLILMKIVCFILGYLTVRLGYKLIRDGVKGEFKFSASFGGTKADLASVSPGLLFVLLGVGLVGYAIYVDKSVDLKRNAQELAPVESAEPPAGETPFGDERKGDSPAGGSAGSVLGFPTIAVRWPRVKE